MVRVSLAVMGYIRCLSERKRILCLLVEVLRDRVITWIDNGWPIDKLKLILWNTVLVLEPVVLLADDL